MSEDYDFRERVLIELARQSEELKSVKEDLSEIKTHISNEFADMKKIYADGAYNQSKINGEHKKHIYDNSIRLTAVETETKTSKETSEKSDIRTKRAVIGVIASIITGVVSIILGL